jgi:putative membrane protein
MSVTDSITTLVITADHWDGDGPPFWPIFPILWFLAFITFATLVVLLRRRHCGYAPRRSGEARLAEMYATGEISDEEYRARRSVLRER